MKVKLPHQDRHEKDNSVLIQVDIDVERLKIEETPVGVRIDLGKDYEVYNEPGTPSLPSRIIQVALPANANDIRVSANPTKSKRLFKKPVFIMPVPNPQLSAKENGDAHRLKKEEIEKLKKGLQFDRQETRSIPNSAMRYVPNQEKYNQFFKEPDPVAKINTVLAVGANSIVYIRINPVTISKDYIPELHEHIEITVHYEMNDQHKGKDKKIYRSLPQQEILREAAFESLKYGVINPGAIIDIHPYPWVIYGPYNYIVITDNYRWNSETMTRGDYVGELVPEFERLVDWKKQKGLTARVVTITDIMNNVYGNFKVDAVDLQEVIRNFLKFAHSNWGICWCLLGGDTEIVPIRQAAGEFLGDMSETTVNNPPEDNESFWTGTFKKIKAVDLGVWFSVGDPYLRLTSQVTGRLIPKKAPRNVLVIQDWIIAAAHGVHGVPGIHPPTGFNEYVLETTEQFRSRIGWYFCTDNTYTTYSAMPTQFVRVDGPASVVNAQLRFHYTWNTIPTDFYYASLFGPSYDIAGRHDWDYNNNKVYGQKEGATEFDPINWNSDICVGRAPASNASDAGVFVNKVIAYEQFRRSDGGFIDPNYIDKMLLVSDNFGGRYAYYPTTNDPPQEGHFHTQAAQSRAILQTWADNNLNWDWQLLSWINDNDVWMIPFNLNARAGVRGFYYARSATDLRPAVMTINMFFGLSFDIPLITHTLVIYASGAEIAPAYFVMDDTIADGSMMEKEALREQVDAQLPFINRFNRLYLDIESLRAANLPVAPLSRLTTSNLEQALNEGQHFVSLTGHGDQNGCCLLDQALASTINNGNKCFIAFADSCLTNSYESEDAMSEALVRNPSGGAVAYLGNTRFGFIGIGSRFEQAFFRALVFTRHLGLLHRSRLDVLLTDPTNIYFKWTVLTLNLLGDPEMEVWKRKPYHVIFEVFLIESRLYVRGWNKEDKARKELKGIRVKMYAGEKEYELEADHDNMFPVSNKWIEQGEFRIAVSTPGSTPQIINGKDILERSRRIQAEEITEEKEVITIQEKIKDLSPIKPSDVPVMEMQTEPQHN
jgi:hypothetical protein